MIMKIMIMILMININRVIFNVICSREGGEVISRSSLRSRLCLAEHYDDDDDDDDDGDDVTLMMMMIRIASKNAITIIIIIILINIVIIILICMIITRNFYENFTGLSGDTLEKVATEGFRSMTAVRTMMMMIATMTTMTMMMMMNFDDDDDNDDDDDDDDDDDVLCRTGTMSWTTAATSFSFQTSYWVEQSMDQVFKQKTRYF